MSRRFFLAVIQVWVANYFQRRFSHLCDLRSSADKTEQLLRMKEARDAKARGEPVNQADLRLNRAARELFGELRDVDPSSAAKNPFGDLLRAKLGEGGRPTGRSGR